MCIRDRWYQRRVHGQNSNYDSIDSFASPQLKQTSQHNQGCDSEAYSSPLKTNFSKNLNTKQYYDVERYVNRYLISKHQRQQQQFSQYKTIYTNIENCQSSRNYQQSNLKSSQDSISILASGSPNHFKYLLDEQPTTQRTTLLTSPFLKEKELKMLTQQQVSSLIKVQKSSSIQEFKNRLPSSTQNLVDKLNSVVKHKQKMLAQQQQRQLKLHIVK
eukprot:TRINITY_DN2696_c0_g1_i1.p1 TRINITY_DN2696_c0_g1~~TRINITY_DN2696_c0_g1_i1.p1  ORF type:complete len:216 (-),score=25.72 TRINITY_DN2696_c0_g1_i1:215-862(-)